MAASRDNVRHNASRVLVGVLLAPASGLLAAWGLAVALGRVGDAGVIPFGAHSYIPALLLMGRGPFVACALAGMALAALLGADLVRRRAHDPGARRGQWTLGLAAGQALFLAVEFLAAHAAIGDALPTVVAALVIDFACTTAISLVLRAIATSVVAAVTAAAIARHRPAPVVWRPRPTAVVSYCFARDEPFRRGPPALLTIC